MSNFKRYIRKRGYCCHINSRLFEGAVEDLNRIDLIGFRSRTDLRVRTAEGYLMPQNYLQMMSYSAELYLKSFTAVTYVGSRLNTFVVSAIY